jgi:hypothetical protein
MAEARKKGTTPRRATAAAPAGSGAGRSRTDGYDDDHDDEREESVAAHARFVERHFGGGAPPSAELLDRANAVWRRLPGSVAGAAGLVRPLRPAPRPEPDDATGGRR